MADDIIPLRHSYALSMVERISELEAEVERMTEHNCELATGYVQLLDHHTATRLERDRLRAVVDALVARPFRGTSVERRDRLYGSDWEAVHDALDAWQEARRG